MKTHGLVKSVLVLLVGLSGFMANAAEDDGNLLVFEKPEAATVEQKATVDSPDLEVRMDLSEVQVEDLAFDRKAFAEQALEAMKNPVPEDTIYDFTAPRTPEDLDRLMGMSDSEIVSFLAKKQAFLQKFTKTLSFFKLKPKKINKALNELNDRFYRSARVVAKSNFKGVTTMFSVSGGLALPQKITQSLRKRSVGKFIPETGGFYYMMGLGASIGRKVDENGKGKMVVELFVDLERLKSTLTGIVEVSAAGTYGLVFENREGKFASQKSTVMYGGATGVFRQGRDQFGWAASTGLSLPPGIGIILVYQDEATRYYLFRSEGLKAYFPALKLIKDNVISSFRSLLGGAVRCEKALL